VFASETEWVVVVFRIFMTTEKVLANAAHTRMTRVNNKPAVYQLIKQPNI
jgi:hypothetical protein